MGVFIERVEVNEPGFGQLMRDADVVIVGFFDSRRGILGVGGSIGGAGKFGEGVWGYVLHGRGDEISGIPGVEGGVARGFPDEINAWAELALMVEIGGECVETAAVI